MIISVTKKHIDAGRPGDESACPVALACKERGIKFKSAGVYGLYSRPGCSRRIFNFPSRMSSWIANFDLGFEVSPTRFTLSPVTKGK